MQNQNKFPFDKKERTNMSQNILEKKTVHSIIPAVNIVETPTSYVVTLDIPGAAKDRIKANIENNTLFISADVLELSTPEQSDIAKQYRREFSLAQNIDLNTIDAQYDLGVLTITLNKKQQYLPKQITVN